MPSERSVYFTRRLIPGAETLSSLAAPPMVPVTITARITSTWRSVIMNRASENDRGGDHLTRDARSASGKCLMTWMVLHPPLEGEGRSREARAGWGDLSTRAEFIAERLSPHPVSHCAALHVSRPSPSRGG